MSDQELASEEPRDETPRAELPPEATLNYEPHPMGYQCRVCTRAGRVGNPVHHSPRCTVAPLGVIVPAWPTEDELVDLDRRIASGDRTAAIEAEMAMGLRPKMAVGTWARWRSCERGWAIRLTDPMLPGAPVCVVRRDGTTSIEWIYRLLWLSDDGSVRLVEPSYRSEEEDKQLARVVARMRYQ